MSNIFNFLGGTTEPDRDQVIKSITRSRTSQEIRLNSFKTMGGTKPKGLSIRSNSDMNVSHSTHLATIKKNTYSSKEQDFLKLKVTQVDSNGCPISPGKEIPKKKLIAQPIKYKGLISKEETMIDKNTKIQKMLNDDIFKKPLPSKGYIKRFPEPENLAHCYEDQYEFDYGHIEIIEKELEEFKLLLKEKENVVPHSERELMSDSETLISPEIPGFILPKFIDLEYMDLTSPELPEISNNKISNF